MAKLEPPNTHYLSAAIGWLELGNPAEAKAELACVEPEFREHPDILEGRWLVAAEEGDWEEALIVARGLVRVQPEQPTGWLHQAYALRRGRKGGLEKAWEALLPVSDSFPKEPTVAYNLSCYACQMGRLEAARVWLRKAMQLGDKEHLKDVALQDQDLEPLWNEIRQL